MFAVYGIIVACLIAGSVVVYHSIGASAVAKHELDVKVEQDKRDAVAHAKTEAAAQTLVAMQESYERGRAQREIVEKKVYIKGQDVVRTLPAAARSVDCTIPPAGMALLNGARGDLANTTAAEILPGYVQHVDAPVTIRDAPPPEPVTTPPPAPPPPAGSSTRPPRPTPK